MHLDHSNVHRVPTGHREYRRKRRLEEAILGFYVFIISEENNSNCFAE